MLTATEVAELLGVSPRMVYELRKAGKLPGYQIGRAVRFKPADVEGFRESCRSIGTSVKSAGASISNESFKAVATGLAASFRAAGVKAKLTPSTVKRVRACTPLQLAYKSE